MFPGRLSPTRLDWRIDTVGRLEFEREKWSGFVSVDASVAEVDKVGVVIDWCIMGWKAAQKLIHHWKILRGDNVMIIRGKDIGETGAIKRVIRSQNRVIVEGKNLVKKHIKQGQGHEGGIFTVEAPLHVSNVQIVDPVTQQPCKVGIRYQEDGTKVRVSRGIGTSGAIIPRPEILKIRTTPRPAIGYRASPKEYRTLKL
ncbi:ribosomal protein L24 [Tanacetum coccineum]